MFVRLFILSINTQALERFRISVRNSPTLLEFKTKLRNQAQKNKASGILSIGERKLIIILTRIRHNCSNLNADPHRVNIVPSHSCSCSANFETVQHYFIECRNFVNQRQNLFRALSFISVITLDTLLYGFSTFDNERNALIITAVLLFIKETKRFDKLFLLCNKTQLVQTIT